MKATATTTGGFSLTSGTKVVLGILGTLAVLAVLIWQGLAAHGTPDPTAQGLSTSAMAMSSAVLVFREGLEAILVLVAITAGLSRFKKNYWPPVLTGIGAALVATVVTWFIAVALISSVNARELDIQAGTGLLAIVVLLIVMNWFFHKLYWSGWICHHCKRRKEIFAEPDASPFRVNYGLALLGFTAIYREGFEIVLFLQDLRLKAGTGIVMSGAGIGIALTCVVAALAFSAQKKLPYKKMLVYTGVMLAGVLVVMVGENVQEMQLAGWIPTHELGLPIPRWVGTWFAAFPNAEGLVSQVVAAVLVLGSYAWVRSQVPKGSDGQKVTAVCDAAA